MHNDNLIFIVIPATMGVITGAIVGGWLGSVLNFTILGLIVGALFGVICALFLSIKVYSWAVDDLEEEWRQERKKGDQARKNDSL